MYKPDSISMKKLLITIFTHRYKCKSKLINEVCFLTAATPEGILGGIVSGLNHAGNPAKPMIEQEKDVYPLAVGFFGSGFGLLRVSNHSNGTGFA